jgi:hypothetical protein
MNMSAYTIKDLIELDNVRAMLRSTWQSSSPLRLKNRSILNVRCANHLLRASPNHEEYQEAIHMMIHPNSSVLALAILLIEITLGKPIEDNIEEDDLDEDGKSSVNTNYFAASRVFECYRDDFYPEIEKAISFCLNCSTDAEPSFHDDKFRYDFHQEVVRPLESDLWEGFRIYPQEIGIC